MVNETAFNCTNVQCVITSSGEAQKCHQRPKCEGMPNTNNKIEGTFTDLKKNLNNHSGMSIQNRMRFISGYLTKEVFKGVSLPACKMTHTPGFYYSFSLDLYLF